MTRATDVRARWGAVLAVFGLWLVVMPASASGATFTVNSLADASDFSTSDPDCDSSASSNVCTLRAAVQQARANTGDDTIVLPAGEYQLTLAGPDEDPGALGDLDLGAPAPNAPESITIVGAGARSTRVAQLTDDRVFHLISANTTANLSGLTVTGGNSVQQGGGILNASGTLNLTDVAIVSNDSTQDGGGLSSGAVSNLNRVLVSGNDVDGCCNTPARSGGGVAALGPVGSLSLANVTISGNSSSNSDGPAQAGGLYFGAATGALTNVTIVDNTTDTADPPTGGGVVVDSTLDIRNTIVAQNRLDDGTPSNCVDTGSAAPFANSLGNNLESGTDCGFTATGDKQIVDPLLGPVADNGGQTDTRALLAGSPALDAGSNTGCPSVDQRGVTRPQNLVCDIGAFEFAPPILPPPPGDNGALPPPVLGRTVNVVPVSGKVTFAVPAGASAASANASQKGLRFRPLSEARQLPVRSFLNTRKGTVRLTSARNTRGATQNGTFGSGLFQILQSRKRAAKGLTELRLKGSSFRSCNPRPRKRGKRAQAALSRKSIRRLRANSGGRFRTRGRYSAATVRGTKWLTVDRCDGTLTKVTRGRVAVRDFRRKKTIVVKRGKSYLAKAPAR